MPTREQFQGCIVGCAVGDAIGSPLEMAPPEDARAYIRDNVETGLYWGVKREHGNFDFGQYTDDTQLTCDLVESLIAHNGKLDPEDFANRMVRRYTEDMIVGSGRSTRMALGRVRDGASWDEAGTPAPAAGNGAAMRAAPIGLAYYDENKAFSFFEVARDQSISTHAAPDAILGAFLMAYAVGGVLHDSVDLSAGDRQRSAFFQTLANVSVVGQTENNYRDALWFMAHNLDMGREQMLERVLETQEASEIENEWPGISPYVVPSVLWSIYSFVRSPSDYLETVKTAIWPGGDIDTMAAMAGALSGAYNGVGAIPNNVAQQVNDRGAKGYDYLVVLAGQLYDVVVGDDE